MTLAARVLRLRTNFAQRSSLFAQDDRPSTDDSPIVTLNDIREAQSRLRGVAVRTKLIRHTSTNRRQR